MAYAALANVNTIVGLYTSLFPTLIYVLFGTSKHITIGNKFYANEDFTLCLYLDSKTLAFYTE